MILPSYDESIRLDQLGVVDRPARFHARGSTQGLATDAYYLILEKPTLRLHELANKLRALPAGKLVNLHR